MQYWMRNRKAYELKSVCAVHNGLLAAFSLVVLIGQSYATWIESEVTPYKLAYTPEHTCKITHPEQAARNTAILLYVCKPQMRKSRRTYTHFINVDE
jgi:hypothetical protein